MTRINNKELVARPNNRAIMDREMISVLLMAAQMHALYACQIAVLDV